MYRLEGLDFRAVVGLDVVDRHPAVCALEELASLLWNTFEGPITRLEVENGRPIVTEVLAVRATGAGGAVGLVALRGVHGDVEGIASDELDISVSEEAHGVGRNLALPDVHVERD